MRISMSGIMFDDESVREAIEAAAKIGYNGIELREKERHLPVGTSMKQVREIKKMAHDQGLEITCIASFTGGYSKLSNNKCEVELSKFKQCVDMACELRCDLIRHWTGGPSSDLSVESDWEKASTWIEKACDYAQKKRIQIGLEIHHNTLIDTIDSALRFVQMVDRENLGLIHDAANMYHEQTDYGQDAIKRLGKHIFTVHVKDIILRVDDSDPSSFEYRGRRFTHKLINQGGVDQFSVFKGLMAIGYKGYVTVESSGLLEPYELARYSYEEIKKILKALDNKEI